MKQRTIAFCFLIAVIAAGFTLCAQVNNEWQYIRPTNTGIGGDYNYVVNIDRLGNKWTTGYMPIWSEGSVARFDDSIWTNWSNFEGYIPDDRVYAIEFDGEGKVWVGTDSGVAVYNGKTWIKYTSANTPFTYFSVRSIGFDSKKNTWLTFKQPGGINGGIAKFDGVSWSIYTKENSGLLSNEVTELAVDKLNNIWVGTEEGLAKFDGASKWTIFNTSNSGLSENEVADIEIDSLNKVYILEGSSLDILQNGTWSHYNATNSPITSSNYCLDISGDKIMIGTLWSRTLIFNGAKWSTYNTPNHVYDVRFDEKGNYWMCGIGYLIKYNGVKTVTYTRFNTGLTDYFNNDIFIDSKNRKWFANGQGGINLFDKPYWEDFSSKNEGLFPNPVPSTTIGTATTEDKTGDIWMAYKGNAGAVVQVPHGNTADSAAWIVWESANAGVNLQDIQCISSDSSGNAWVGLKYNAEVSKYNRATGKWKSYYLTSLGLPGSSFTAINSIQTDAHGRVWICDDGGIAVFNNGVWTLYSFLNSGLPGWGNYDLDFDSKGNTWIGTDSGLVKFDGTNWTTFNTANSNIISNHVQAVAVGINDTVYAGSFNVTDYPYKGGVSIFDGKSKWQNLLEGRSPLPHKQVEDLEIDRYGNLWILCQSVGIAIYHKGGVIESGVSCNVPINNSTSNIGANNATLSWQATAGALKYQVYYKIAGTDTFTTVTTRATSITLNGLNSGTRYNWKVRAKCAEGNSAFSPNNRFITSSTFATALGVDNSPATQIKLRVYPLPAVQNMVTVVFPSAANTHYEASLYDMRSSRVLARSGKAVAGSNTIQLDVSHLASSVYLLKLVLANGEVLTAKIIK